MRVALIGEFTPDAPTHLATEAALVHSAAWLQVRVDARWISTNDIDAGTVDHFDALWIAPGSPYRNMSRTLWLIQQARERQIPCLGTCGGFQHMLIEFARHALGIADAEHAEYDPYASRLVVSRLVCSLVGLRLPLTLAPDARVAAIYGTTSVTEEYYCNFGLNPEYAAAFVSSAFRTVGWDSDGQPRVMEITQHPFFVGTLFVPQARSTLDAPHPLVTAFLDVAHQRAQASSAAR